MIHRNKIIKLGVISHYEFNNVIDIFSILLVLYSLSLSLSHFVIFKVLLSFFDLNTYT